ncbi:MAG: hypothetical protein ACRCTZ_21840 [Sarcina sp.]
MRNFKKFLISMLIIVTGLFISYHVEKYKISKYSTIKDPTFKEVITYILIK